MVKFRPKLFFIVMAVVGLLIFFHFLGILNPVEKAIVFALKPFTNSLYSAGSNIGRFYQNREDRDFLLNQVNILEQEKNQLLKENIQLKFLEEENKELRQQLNFLEEHKFKYVLANVVSQGVFSGIEKNEKMIIIDKGSSQGVFPGLPLVNSEGVIIGKVFEVKDGISKAYLIIDERCKLAATIQGEEETLGTTEGDFGLTIRMGFIPQTKNILSGDVVVTSGLENNIPKGLILGRVIQVKKENNDVWQSAVIEPVVDLDNIEIVSVIIP